MKVPPEQYKIVLEEVDEKDNKIKILEKRLRQTNKKLSTAFNMLNTLGPPKNNQDLLNHFDITANPKSTWESIVNKIIKNE